MIKEFRKAAMVTVGAVFVSFILVSCSEKPEQALANAEASLSRGEYRSALVQLKALLQKRPDDLKARWLLGSVYLELEDGASAEKELRRAMALGISEESAGLSILQAMLLQDKFDEILKYRLPANASPHTVAEMDATKGLAMLAKKEVNAGRELIDRARDAAPDSLWIMLAEGRLQLASGDPAAAIDSVTKLTRVAPHYGLAWSLLGEAAKATGDLRLAEKAYSEAIKRRPKSATDLFNRGQVRERLGDVSGAAADAEALLKSSPASALGNYLMGLVRVHEERYVDSTEFLDKAAAKDDRHFPTIFLLATSNYKIGNVERARNLAQRAVTLVPTDYQARKLLASIYLDLGKPAEAESLLKPVVLSVPGDATAKEALAESLVRQNRIGDAADLFKDLSLREGAEPVKALQAGAALLKNGKEAEARDSFDLALQMFSQNAGVYPVVVGLLLRNGFNVSALEFAGRFTRDYPENPDAWNALGVCHVANEETQAGKEAFQQALKLKPADPLTSMNLFSLLTQLGEMQESKQILSRALSEHPNDIGLLARQASVEAQLGNAPSARQLLEKALSVNPNAILPRIMLARLFIAFGDYYGALSLLPDVLADKDVDALTTQAEALFWTGNLVATKRALDFASKLNPHSPDVVFGSGMVEAELANTDGVKMAFNTLHGLAQDSAATSLLRINLLILERKFDEARRLLGALEVSPNDANALRVKFLLAKREGDASQMLTAAQLLFDSKPSTLATQSLTDALLINGRLSESVQVAESWSIQHPHDIEGKILLASLYRKIGRDQDAVSALEKVITAYPKNAMALNNLSWYLRVADPQRALELATAAYSLAPESPIVIDTYAEALARAGQLEKALQLLDAAATNRGADFEFKIRRLEILAVSGNPRQAMREADELQKEERLTSSQRERLSGVLRRLKSQ